MRRWTNLRLRGVVMSTGSSRIGVCGESEGKSSGLQALFGNVVMRAGFTTGAAGVLERSNLTVRTRRQAVGPYNGFSRASRDSESWRRLWNWERGRRDLAAVEGSGQRMDIRGGDCEADDADDAEREGRQE